jgi:hypothetical protein
MTGAQAFSRYERHHLVETLPERLRVCPARLLAIGLDERHHLAKAAPISHVAINRRFFAALWPLRLGNDVALFGVLRGPPSDFLNIDIFMSHWKQHWLES